MDQYTVNLFTVIQNNLFLFKILTVFLNLYKIQGTVNANMAGFEWVKK